MRPREPAVRTVRSLLVLVALVWGITVMTGALADGARANGTEAGVSTATIVGREEPTLLGHWRVVAHLAAQWVHLAAFGLWLVAGVSHALRPPARPRVAVSLAWLLLAATVGTGLYNLKFASPFPGGAPVWFPARAGAYLFGRTYMVVLYLKFALTAMLLAFVVMLTRQAWRRGLATGMTSRRRVWAACAAVTALIGACVVALQLLHKAIDHVS